LPAELRRREDRLATIVAAMKRLEAEAKAAADAERQRRDEAEARRERTGTKRRGRAPGPIVETPGEKAQTNFTEPELSIMKTSNKGWDCCGNAQASVDDGCQIILACDVTAECNDKRQAEPMARATRGQLDRAGISPAADESGARPPIPAALDTGYFSAQAVEALEREGFDPHIATERQRHHGVNPTAESQSQSPPPSAALSEPSACPGVPPAASESPPATAKEKMQSKLKTPAGRAVYARRKAIVEPVFGQTKEARGFRRFLLRGLDKIRGEWRLVCLTHNLLKIWRYGRGNLDGSPCALVEGCV
jgi:hypothetical protein